MVQHRIDRKASYERTALSPILKSSEVTGKELVDRLTSYEKVEQTLSTLKDRKVEQILPTLKDRNNALQYDGVVAVAFICAAFMVATTNASGVNVDAAIGIRCCSVQNYVRNTWDSPVGLSKVVLIETVLFCHKLNA
jgi:hypothetical protein